MENSPIATALFESLKTAFESHSNPENAGPMSAYMKNKFPFYGIKTPERRLLEKEVIRNLAIPKQGAELELFVSLCWEQPFRELHYSALSISEKAMKKNPLVADIELLEWMISHQSWWDTVDILASHHTGRYLTVFPEKRLELTEKWINSKNLWLKRTAILFQLGYKEKTDTNLLFSILRSLAHEKEFFIAKAIGWALRQYAYTDAHSVFDFTENEKLQPLSRREALKHKELFQ